MISEDVLCYIKCGLDTVYNNASDADKSTAPLTHHVYNVTGTHSK